MNDGGGWFHPDGPITEPEQIAGRIGDFPIVGMALAPLMHGAAGLPLVSLAAGRHAHFDVARIISAHVQYGGRVAETGEDSLPCGTGRKMAKFFYIQIR